MIVVLEGGEEIALGTVETTPTIGIIDYSRRVTDDFGVTTIVKRGFARRLSVRMAVNFDDVDQVQRDLARIRATPARWIAEDRYAWLDVQGFYKDFELDLNVPPVSFCTLTVEGLAETEPGLDDGADPAPIGRASTLRLVRPAEIASDTVISSVPENDYPEWSAGTTYPFEALVIKAATHRIYQSAQGGNLGHDPAEPNGRWVDVGPTNRWAMLDQALGTATTVAGPIVVTIDVADVNAVALLDVVGTAVRVQAPGYDQTRAVSAGALTFLDLPATTGLITVTITGAGSVSVGTLLLGGLVSLGVTEAAPRAGINDYSRKETDEFGAVTIVERAWAKRMAARALICTDAIDRVANRIAAVRAVPCLWIGDEALDSLTIYGFFKEFSIEVGENVSTLTLSVEGLSQAAPRGGLLQAPNWTDIVDNDPVNHPKPQDGADVTGENTANDTANVGGLPTPAVLAYYDQIVAGLLAQASAAYDRDAIVQAIGYVDGQPVNAVHVQKETERLEAQTYIYSFLNALGALSEDGSVIITNLSKLMLAPGLSLGQKLSVVDVALDGLVGRTEALELASSDGDRVSGLIAFKATAGGKVTSLRLLSEDGPGEDTDLSVIDLASEIVRFDGKFPFIFDTETGLLKLHQLEVDGAKIKTATITGSLALAPGTVVTGNLAADAVHGGLYDAELASNTALPAAGVRARYISGPFTKKEEWSEVRITFSLHPRPGNAYGGYARVGYRKDGVDHDLGNQIWRWLDTANIGGLVSSRIPVTMIRRFAGIPAGEMTLYVDWFSYNAPDPGSYMEMGSYHGAEEMLR